MKATSIGLVGVLVVLAVVVDGRPHWHKARDETTTNSSQCPHWFSVDYEAVYGSGSCLPCSVFDVTCMQTPLASVPLPHTAYGYALDDPLFEDGGITLDDLKRFTPTNAKTLPHIAVSSIFSNVSHGKNVFQELHPTLAYHWGDFQTNRNDIVWAHLDTGAVPPGVYKVQLNAWDYAQDSGVCELCVSISDHFRPQSTQTCPDDLPTDLIGWQLYWANFTAKVASIQGFATSRTNNDCSTPASALGANCSDVVQVEGHDWFNCPLPSRIDPLKPETALTTPLVAQSPCVHDAIRLNPFVNATILASPDAFLTPNVCSRSLRFNYTWYEPWVRYSCTAPAELHCSNGADVAGEDLSFSGSPDKFGCAGHVTLAATASDIVARATVSLNATTLAGSLQVVSNTRNSSFELRLWAAEDATGDFASSAFRIQSLFVANATLLESFSKTDDASPVFWRWTASNQPNVWHDFTANDVLFLDNLTTTVTFEPWTHCGIVVASPPIVWTITQQLRQSLRGWFHSSWKYVSNTHCNVPWSDFSVVGFHLNATDLLASVKAPKARLESFACSWQYQGKDFTESIDTWSLSSRGDPSDTYFAVKLLNADTTQVNVSCRIKLSGIRLQVVTHAFWFENCDDVSTVWTENVYADETCAAACGTASWEVFENRLPAPFQACQGNLVYPGDQWDANNPVSTILEMNANHSCCRTCDRFGFAHNRIAVCAPSVAPSIARCEPAEAPQMEAAVAMFTSSPRAPLTAIWLAFGSVVVVALLLAHRLHQKKAQSIMGDAGRTLHEPLLRE
ncbi:hypothetical protein AeMF1_009876 [Aphanomyces euteiches]|nr:hypothetical protein AeMF1_009876 [Aphanomyces euteiches]